MYPNNMKRSINLNIRTIFNCIIYQQLRQMINLDDNFYAEQLLRKSSPGSREAVPTSKTILLITRYLN